MLDGGDGMLFVEYPTCSTCRKAKKYLMDKKVNFTDRHIKEEVPTVNELIAWQAKSGKDWNKFFNTSGQVYRNLQLKDKLPQMTDKEKADLLASDGMLIKRPILVTDEVVLVGFKESEWNDALHLG